MTLKGKLGLAATLVVLAGAVVVFLPLEPDLPVGAKVVRFLCQNNAVIRIINKGNSDLSYSVSGIPGRLQGRLLKSFESGEVAVEFTEETIRVHCIRISRIQRLMWLLAEKIGKHGPLLEHWETSVAVPLQN